MIYINNEKLNKIKLNHDNYYVVIDFDRTITSKESLNSYAVCGNNLGEDYLKRIHENDKKYEPIETNYSISFDEKFRLMNEWYSKGLNLYNEFNLTTDLLNNAVDKCIANKSIQFRDGAKNFLECMHKHNIPVIILSAGIANVIELFLKKMNTYYDNIFIVANKIEFDTNNCAKPYTSKIIQTLTKTLNGNLPTLLEEKIKAKDYALLIGDLIEDKAMIYEDMADKTILVSFLNLNIEENFERYKVNFDVVLTSKEAEFSSITNLLNLDSNL